MIAALRSEFRKLLTVRSTYFILGFVLLLEVFFAVYATGYKATATQLANPAYLSIQVTDAITTVAALLSIVGILLVTHEYRYNTIVFTLTAARSRTVVLLAKTIAISVFAIVASLIAGFISPLLTMLGVFIAGHEIGPQIFNVWDLLWRTAFFGWGFSMLAMIFAFIIRAQVGAIVAVFLVPSTVESLLGLLLKNNVVYLPFSSLASVTTAVTQPAVISYGKAALVASAWIIGGWIVAWILFLRRDAN